MMHTRLFQDIEHWKY